MDPGKRRQIEHQRYARRALRQMAAQTIFVVAGEIAAVIGDPHVDVGMLAVCARGESSLSHDTYLSVTDHKSISKVSCNLFFSFLRAWKRWTFTVSTESLITTAISR